MNVPFFRSSSGRCFWMSWLSLLTIGLLSSTEAVVSSAVGSSPGSSTCTTATASSFNITEMMEYILAEDYETMDPTSLPQSIAALKARGAHRCWHKHSTFLQHLTGVHNMLRLWGQGPTIGRVGLFHSAYSNSYVNLALFDPQTERPLMQNLVGQQAESLVHLFCIIDRQDVVVNTLLKQGFIPSEGLTVPHLRNADETVFLSPETLRLLVVFTMADIADQYFGWQDLLFGGGGSEGSMVIPGQDHLERHRATALWPGISKPGLWMSYVSELGRVVQSYQQVTSSSSETSQNMDPHGPILNVPPIFDHCTQTLSVDDESKARDLYWSVATETVNELGEAIATLESCVALNPWAFEPYVLLSQKHLHQGDFEAAKKAAEKALDLQTQWGTAWDKRLSMGAWIAWTRVLLQRAKDQDPWPTNAWAVNNLGLVH